MVTNERVRKRILTWHVHGNYLYYLSQADHDFYLPKKEGGPPGYGGRTGSFPWGVNVYEVPADQVAGMDFDLILFQSHENYLHDQHEILSDRQKHLPRIFLEHDPPRESPTDTKHPVDDPDVLLVHVTHFNNLMWDNNRTPTTVIEHGVLVPDDERYSGEKDCGIVVVNNLRRRGRRLGADLFDAVRKRVPLDLVGMNAGEAGGIGELPYDRLHAFIAQYRFFFNPIRYTSLGLAVCEAMMIGMPVVGLATTEMSVTIENGVSGYVNTNLERLVECMQELIANPKAARRLSAGARAYAVERFNIGRFVRVWDRAFRMVTGS